MSRQLQLFLNTVEHEKSGEFLYYADFTPYLEKKLREKFSLSIDIDLRDYFKMFKPARIGLEAPEGYIKPDFSGYYKDISIPGNAFINDLGVLEIPGSAYHFTRYISPLRNAAEIKDIEAFPFYDYSKYTENNMKLQADSAHRQGKAVSCWIGHMYEDAWQIRGYEQFLEDMLLQEEWCEYILDRIMEKNLICAEAAALAGADMIMTGDDVANQRALMFSPEKWRRIMKVRWAKVYEAARAIKPDISVAAYSLC